MFTNSFLSYYGLSYLVIIIIVVTTNIISFCSASHDIRLLDRTIYMYNSEHRCTFQEYRPSQVIHLDLYQVMNIIVNGSRSANARICTMTFAISYNEQLMVTMDELRINTCKVTARLYLLQGMNQLELRREYNCSSPHYQGAVKLNGGHYYGILEINKQLMNQTNFYCRARVTKVPRHITTTLAQSITHSNDLRQTAAPTKSSHTLLLAIGIVIPLILLIASAFTYHVWRRNQLRNSASTPQTSFTLTRILRHRRPGQGDIDSVQHPGAPRAHIRTLGELQDDPFDILTWGGLFGIFSSMDFPKPVELPPYPGYDPPPPYETIIYDQGIDLAIQPPPPPAPPPAPPLHQMRYHCTLTSVLPASTAPPLPPTIMTTVDYDTVNSPSGNNGIETTV
ncbi:uncharacterized protein LOC115224201 isoform X2 [Argonauta hians]